MNELVEVTVMDLLGQPMVSQQLELVAGVQTHILPIPVLPSSQYVVSIQPGDQEGVQFLIPVVR